MKKATALGAAAAVLVTILALNGSAASEPGMPAIKAGLRESAPQTNPAEKANIVLTSDQEAMFPKDDPIDEELWQRYSHPWRLFNAGPTKKRIFKECLDGYLTPVCHALTVNQRLYGGMRVGGCYTPEANPRSPYAKKFGAIAWEDVDPLQNLPVIRKIFVSRQKRAAAKFQSPTIPDYYWWRMAPIIKRLLVQKQVLLRQSRIDVDGDGTREPVFELILLPSGICLKESGIQSFENSFLYIDEDVPAKTSFNELALGSMGVFLYDRRVYFFNGENLGEGSSISLGSDPNAPREFFIAPRCRFEDIPFKRRRNPH